MAKKTDAAPWLDLEQQAYHAYREWHLWLVLRERELAARFDAMKATPKSHERKDEGT
jgi:hypothetical protein